MFFKYDSNRSGTLEKSEVAKALQDLGELYFEMSIITSQLLIFFQLQATSFQHRR